MEIVSWFGFIISHRFHSKSYQMLQEVVCEWILDDRLVDVNVFYYIKNESDFDWSSNGKFLGCIGHMNMGQIISIWSITHGLGHHKYYVPISQQTTATHIAGQLATPWSFMNNNNMLRCLACTCSQKMLSCYTYVIQNNIWPSVDVQLVWKC